MNKHLQQALQIVGSNKAKPDMPVRVNQKFLSDFAKVSKYYMLEELGEIEAAKAAARADIESAMFTYAVLAKEVDAETGSSLCAEYEDCFMAADGRCMVSKGK